ncbi:DUF2500 domain-containing protein [Vibrio genomosp. F10]|uniref:RNA polymerase subunit sigma n=2 Tax=Vibrio genomosp. F10 TaxID=723171 RepID=A0A1B9R288_9VIBR|nr:DUF2500 domain-containing protein [Vibrio genomosp. F10]OCH78275.1 RNA polymerase subunit sigma [Vibrio genomosp. F10]OEE36260.1 RNA polymerase subunit sigma [Vibrio genomosp. F10 str. ZF-129]OEE98523.1 RNA polymerase subunit sigma [Vibrio genomosp. F10 str. 9ZD137]OEE98544.1 RNA polymerase subunit sigma [Vibrio genomosp. F10 str. 9ZC157]OEF04221.1 RNA polymerase subunit sigma [Vibrio genomosp. F10 str. 9ZB36]
MPVSLFIAVALLALGAAWVFLGFYRKHIQGENAPEQSVNVTILDKQTIQVPDAQPGEEEEFWIYVQRGAVGPKREFQIGVHYYHALNPGDKGTLTYQGDKFLHFAMKR